jgi:ketosteroid isomerase-like protein
MSQENVEIVRRGWEAWVRGDLDALLELCDPAVEWDTTHMEGWPEDAVYFGRGGVRRFLEEWLGSWERFESGAEKILEAGGDRVVVICWQQGFGPGSEVPVHMDWAQICTLQRGLVCRVEAYSDRAQALEAAGLRAMSQENVEIVLRSLDAWNRRDIAGALALADPEAEYVNPASAVEPGTRRGTTELTAVLRAQWETLTDGRWEIDRIYDRGEEVIALGRVSRRMPGSDARIEDQVLTSWKINSGKVVRVETLGFGRAEVQSALEAAGLRE